MDFHDKNGTKLTVGCYITPDEGRKLYIVSVEYIDELSQECMIGQQVEDPDAYSILTQENLSSQWTLSDD